MNNVQQVRPLSVCGYTAAQMAHGPLIQFENTTKWVAVLFRLEEQVCRVETVALWDHMNTFKPSKLFLASTYTQVHIMFSRVCFHSRWDTND